MPNVDDIVDALILSHLKKKSGMKDVVNSFAKCVGKENVLVETRDDSALAATIGIKTLHHRCTQELPSNSVLESLVHVFLNVQVSRGVFSKVIGCRSDRRVSFKEDLVNERFYHVEDPTTRLLAEKPPDATEAGRSWKQKSPSGTVVMDSSDISKWTIGMRVHCKIPSKNNCVMPALVVKVTPSIAGSTTGPGTVEVCPLEEHSTIQPEEEEGNDNDDDYNFDDDNFADGSRVLPPGL